jgi:hypothetical protein
MEICIKTNSGEIFFPKMTPTPAIESSPTHMQSRCVMTWSVLKIMSSVICKGRHTQLVFYMSSNCRFMDDIYQLI